MNPRYTVRQSDHRGSPYWYVLDRVTDDEATWNPEADAACGVPDEWWTNGYTEAQARAVADWLNQHDTTHPDDIPAPE